MQFLSWTPCTLQPSRNCHKNLELNFGLLSKHRIVHYTLRYLYCSNWKAEGGKKGTKEGGIISFWSNSNHVQWLTIDNLCDGEYHFQSPISDTYFHRNQLMFFSKTVLINFKKNIRTVWGYRCFFGLNPNIQFSSTSK